ncbi:hypothetical protein ACFOET_08125 [Parapedobacter deserti]|uniref:Uncharacterized protein n=1 Tax=Parapedobacter deserti TaxID=1912957 RepID=A0ABV7JL29_9SPHI
MGTLLSKVDEWYRRRLRMVICNLQGMHHEAQNSKSVNR